MRARKVVAVKRMLLIEAVWRYMPGWHLVSGVFHVRVYGFFWLVVVRGKRVKFPLSTLFCFSLFSCHVWLRDSKANVGLNRLLRSARVLFYNIDELSGNMPAFGALLVLAFADVTLIQFWPWKESLTDMETFEFYPSRDVLGSKSHT